MASFAEWITQELDKRGWSRSEAARRGGISASMMDQVIGGFAKPGIRFCEGLARAFGLSLEEVFRRAGILPAIGELPEGWYETGKRLMALSAENRANVVRVLETTLAAVEGAAQSARR